MPIRPNDPLLASARIVILVFQAILGLAAIMVTLVIPVVIFGRDFILAEIREETGNAAATFPVWDLLPVLAIALAVVVLAFLFLGKLRAIVDTVGEGDPFVPANADRLTAMGWMMVATQLLSIAVVPFIIRVQDAFEETNATFDTDIDLGGIVLAITLFILARVFRHGAAMREDLDGTV